MGHYNNKVNPREIELHCWSIARANSLNAERQWMKELKGKAHKCSAQQLIDEV